MTKIGVPTFDALMNPLIKALKELGGSGTICARLQWPFAPEKWKSL